MQERNDIDKAVCLMDIPDDWGCTYKTDLYKAAYTAACEFQAKHPDTLWCLGNHDLSYVWEQLESGFSPLAVDIVRDGIRDLRNLLPEQKQIGYIHRVDKVLFSHAGLSDLFYQLNVEGCLPEGAENDVDAVVSEINTFRRQRMWSNHSPIWLRPQEKYSGSRPDNILYRPDEFVQVVGHTPMPQITRERSLISTDVFSTRRDGTPIGQSAFPVIDTTYGTIIEEIPGSHCGK